MSGGAAGGFGTQRSEGESAVGILPFLLRLSGQLTPAQLLIFDQLEEVLKTGGSGADIPAIQNAVAGQGRAADQSRLQVSENLRLSGLDQTPFGRNILAELELQGRRNQAAVPQAFASQLLGSVDDTQAGTLGSLFSGLASRTKQRSKSQQFQFSGSGGAGLGGG